MTIRTKRRASGGGTLEDRSDSELKSIYFFGDICSDPFTVIYRATPEEQKRAGEILREREQRGERQRGDR
jgi:hypothetical protein